MRMYSQPSSDAEHEERRERARLEVGGAEDRAGRERRARAEPLRERAGERAAEEQLLGEGRDHDDHDRGQREADRRLGSAREPPRREALALRAVQERLEQRGRDEARDEHGAREREGAARGARAARGRSRRRRRPAARPRASRRRARRRRRGRRGSSRGRRGSGCSATRPRELITSVPATSSDGDVGAERREHAPAADDRGKSRGVLRRPPARSSSAGTSSSERTRRRRAATAERSTRIARRPAAAAPSPSFTGSSPTWTHSSGASASRSSATRNGRGSGLAAPTPAECTTISNVLGEAEPAQHGRQRDVPVRDDGEPPSLRRERVERGRGVGERRERDGVGQAGQELGAVRAGGEHVREHVGALEAERRERRVVGRARAVRAVVAPSRPAWPPRSDRARRSRPRRARSERCRRGAGGSRRTQRAERVEQHPADHGSDSGCRKRAICSSTR